MITKWTGNLKVAFITVSVDEPGYDPLPADWEERVFQRIFYDPIPGTDVDGSLRAYINTISQGRAQFDADMFGPLTVAPCSAGLKQAINAVPTSHLYDVVCIVFPGGTHKCGGQAVLRGADGLWRHFNPPRSPNRLLGWCRFRIDDSLGVWAMEFLHSATGFRDLYLTTEHPRQFDEMACSCGTHPSSFTKWKLGWLDDSAIINPVLGVSTFTVHALALLQPPPPDRVTAIRIPIHGMQHYFLIEARLRLDPYERETIGLPSYKVSDGIPEEGVVVYEVDETVWAPMKLRSPGALSVGQSYSNPSKGLTITVKSAVLGGFVVEIDSCEVRRQEIQAKELEIEDLERELDMNGEDFVIRDKIREAQADIAVLKRRYVANGCGNDVVADWLVPVLNVMMS